MLVLPGVKMELLGVDRLRQATEPFVIVSNHQSIADIIILLAYLPRFKFVAKPALFKIPAMGLHLWLAGYIRASRGEPGGSERVLRQAQRWLRRGEHVMVFAEGTRSVDSQLLRF